MCSPRSGIKYPVKKLGGDPQRFMIENCDSKSDPKKLIAKMIDQQNEFLVPEPWRLAFKVSHSMQQVFTSLETIQDKQKLLRMIYFERGIRVAANGRIMRSDLRPGFEVHNE